MLQKNTETIMHSHHSPNSFFDKNDRTMIHKGALENNLSVIKIGLKLGLSIDAQDKQGLTPLMLAAIKGHHQSIESLLEYSACPIIKDKEQHNAFDHAIINNKETCALNLFALTSDTNHIDGRGRNTLMLAIMSGNSQILPHLLSLKPNLNLRCHKGFTALHYAAQLGRVDAIYMLAAAGHSLDIQQQHHKIAKDTGMTPLQVAAISQNKQVILALLSLGASMNAFDKKGRTFLHYAAHMKNESLNQIILHHTSLDDTTTQTDLLMAVVTTDNVSLFHQLINLGLSINTCNKHGATLLHQAIVTKQYAMVELLLSYGVNPCAKTILGEQPIHYAAEIGDIALMRELAKEKYQVDFNAVNAKGENVLHIAAALGHEGVSTELLRLKKGQALLEQFDHKNRTPIDLANLNGHLSLANRLISNLPSELKRKKLSYENNSQLGFFNKQPQSEQFMENLYLGLDKN
jgi:ankyrin repeat protein